MGQPETRYQKEFKIEYHRDQIRDTRINMAIFGLLGSASGMEFLTNPSYDPSRYPRLAGAVFLFAAACWVYVSIRDIGTRLNKINKLEAELVSIKSHKDIPSLETVSI